MHRSLIVVFTVALGACAGDAAEVTSGTTASTPSPFQPDTSWDLAVLSADGGTLELRIGSQPEGDGPCEERFRYEVTETDDTVIVAFDRVERTTTTEMVTGCIAMARPQHFDIHLASPLDDRDLYDGLQAQPRQVWRLAEVVEATVLPDGVAAEDLVRTPGGDFSSVSWSQSATVPSGPGWALWIDQRLAGSFKGPSTEPDAVIGTTRIHGLDATIYEYFNHTGHMIQWTEGGLDITVRAELHTANMSEPRSFANPEVAFIDEILVRVADGIAIP